MTTAEMEAGDETMESDDISDMDMEPGGADDETTTPGAPPARRRWLAMAAMTGYRPFTSEFDEVVAAADLCTVTSCHRVAYWTSRSRIPGGYRQIGQPPPATLDGETKSFLEFDLDEGIDAGRLSRVVTTPLCRCPSS